MKARHETEESGFSLIEVLVGMSLIMLVLTSGAVAMMDMLGAQQNNERYMRGVQLSRDYITRVEATTWNQIGFRESDRGYRDKVGARFTHTIPEGSLTTGVFPLEERNIGGVQYTVRTDILKNNINDTYQARSIRVNVTYKDNENKEREINIEALRAPTPSEQIPAEADLTSHLQSSGAPTAPTFYDEINQYAGSYSPTLGTNVTVRVMHPGDSPVNNIHYTVYCPGLDPYTFSYTNPPSGIVKSNTNGAWTIRYLSKPTGLPCELSNPATTLSVEARNNQGLSAPLSIMYNNFDQIGF